MGSLRAGDRRASARQGEPAAEVVTCLCALAADWSSSLDETAYLAGVSQIRDRIAAGEVYQASLCRVMSHPLPEDADLTGLETIVREGNPASYASRVHVPEAGLDVVCASPEAFLIRSAGRIESRPIKGTATTMSTMLAKDYAENVMIADLVRYEPSLTSSQCRAGRTAGRSDGWMQTPARPSLLSAYAPSGPIGTPPDSGG